MNYVLTSVAWYYRFCVAIVAVNKYCDDQEFGSKHRFCLLNFQT